MKEKIDYRQLIELKDLYLEQPGAQQEDLDVLFLLSQGRSVLSVSHAVHKSQSSVYRIRKRALNFLNTCTDTHRKEDSLQQYTVVHIPALLLPSVKPSDEALCLYQLCIAFFLREELPFIPLPSLQHVSPSMVEEEHVLQVIEEMKHMSLDERAEYPIYKDLRFDGGIQFEFSALTILLLYTFPASYILQSEDGPDK